MPIIIAIAFLLGGIAGAMPADTVLSRAMILAHKGELDKPELVRALESRFKSGSTRETRLYSAYLLTFAPRRMMSERRIVFLDFVLGSSDAEKIIGKEAVLRCLRMRADDAYEEAKFSQAIPDFSALYKKATGFLHDYALLKLGWCYMNLEKPQGAVEIWLPAIENGIADKATLSPNLIRSLGQAFVENKARTSAEGARIGAIGWNEAQRQSLFDGFHDGLDALEGEALSAFGKHALAFPWAPELTKYLLEKSNAGTKRSCDLLPWIAVVFPEGPLSFETFGPRLSACVAFIGDSSQKQKASPELTRLATSLLARLDVKGSQRKPRMELYKAQNDSLRYCNEGLTWLSESLEMSERMSAPVKEIATQCQTTAQAASDEWATATVEKLHASVDSLASEKDPLLFVATHLLSGKKIRQRLAEKAAIDPARYGKTLLPTLIAEKYVADKDAGSAKQLFAVYGSDKRSGVWMEIRNQELAKLVEAKRYSEAYAMVETEPVPVWLAVSLKAKDDSAIRPRIQSRLETILTPDIAKAQPKLAPALLELGAEFKLWEKVWKALFNTPTVSEKLQAQLFEAIATKQLDPRESSKLPSQETRFFAETARLLRDGDLDGVARQKAVGKSLMAVDVRFLNELGKKKEGALATKKDFIAQAITWVNFLDRNAKSVRKRVWSHKLFYQAGARSISDFCRKAKAKLPTDTSDPKLAEVVPVLESRLSECISEGEKS